MITLKLTAVGNSAGVVFIREVMARLKSTRATGFT
jgi:hypothetical protein